MNRHLQGLAAGASAALSRPEEVGSLPGRSVEDEIMAVLRAESAAFFRGDFEEFARHWVHGPEVRRVHASPVKGTLISVGWAETYKRLREAFRCFPQAFDIDEWLRWDNLQIQAGTDMAWVTYDQVAIRHNENIASSDFQHETKILRRVDGEWKLVFISIIVPNIERSDTPRIELSKDEEICHISALARERLRDHPGLVVSGGRVRARNRRFDAGLQEEIKRVLKLLDSNFALGSMHRSVEAVPLGEDDFGHPIYCWVTSEHERILITFDDAHMIEVRLKLSAGIYALSPAQQSLAKLLTSGTDLAGAAREMEVTVNTLRTQLRRMFEKTGTHNQTALISALLSVQNPA